MSQQSNCTRRRLFGWEIEKCRSIATVNESVFVWVGKNGIPGNDLTGWFDSPNQGEPFDRDRARRISEALNAANVHM